MKKAGKKAAVVDEIKERLFIAGDFSKLSIGQSWSAGKQRNKERQTDGTFYARDRASAVHITRNAAGGAGGGAGGGDDKPPSRLQVADALSFKPERFLKPAGTWQELLDRGGVMSLIGKDAVIIEQGGKAICGWEEISELTAGDVEQTARVFVGTTHDGAAFDGEMVVLLPKEPGAAAGAAIAGGGEVEEGGGGGGGAAPASSGAKLKPADFTVTVLGPIDLRHKARGGGLGGNDCDPRAMSKKQHAIHYEVGSLDYALAELFASRAIEIEGEKVQYVPGRTMLRRAFEATNLNGVLYIDPEDWRSGPASPSMLRKVWLTGWLLQGSPEICTADENILVDSASCGGLPSSLKNPEDLLPTPDLFGLGSFLTSRDGMSLMLRALWRNEQDEEEKRVVADMTSASLEAQKRAIKILHGWSQQDKLELRADYDHHKRRRDRERRDANAGKLEAWTFDRISSFSSELGFGSTHISVSLAPGKKGYANVATCRPVVQALWLLRGANAWENDGQRMNEQSMCAGPTISSPMDLLENEDLGVADVVGSDKGLRQLAVVLSREEEADQLVFDVVNSAGHRDRVAAALGRLQHWCSNTGIKETAPAPKLKQPLSTTKIRSRDAYKDEEAAATAAALSLTGKRVRKPKVPGS